MPADVQPDEDKLVHVLEGPAQCAVAGACWWLEQGHGVLSAMHLAHGGD